MTLSGTSDLYIVELLIYLFLLPFTIYLGYRHGSAGLLGYFYLNVTCAVRITADIVSLLPANRDATHPTIVATVLSSVGLSPLMLALSGFVHEAHVRIVDATPRTTRQTKRLKGWLWFAQFQIHSIAIIGMVLLIIGNIKLVAPPTVPLTQSQTKGDEDLRSAGTILLLILWIGLAQYCLFITRTTRRVATRDLGMEDIVNLKRMATWILLATPLVGLRCAYSVAYTFDHDNPKLSPVTGELWVKVVFVVLPSFGAVVSMCLSGWISRCVSNNNIGSAVVRGTGDNVRYTTVVAEGKR